MCLKEATGGGYLDFKIGDWKKMFENKTEEQAKKEILDMVAEYCDTFHTNRHSDIPRQQISFLLFA